MHIVSCPSCGAEVTFRSHAAVMAVCGFCRATLLKDAESVKNLGTMSSVLEDYSPIQIGTCGIHGGRNFTVLGRIQLRYAQGMWNEWYVLFGDGGSGWLGDSSGQFTMTGARKVQEALPAFDALRIAQPVVINGETFLPAEIRSAECIAGQGELPFRVGEGWRIRVADLRNGAAFVTLDYTDGEVPLVYSGVAVTLDEMRCQLLRDDDQVKAGAGRFRGKVDALDCPSCGSAIKYLPGITTTLICPACKAQLDASGPQASVLAAGDKVAAMRTTIELGATANIRGSQHTVIGAMVRSTSGTGASKWTEYLLFSARGGFFWLVETNAGWFQAKVMHRWPSWNPAAGEVAKAENQNYEKSDSYLATVVAAAGAFNWRVSVGDQVFVTEYENTSGTLSAETTREEMTWSRSTRLAYDQIKTWFGVGPKMADATYGAEAPPEGSGSVQKFFWWLLGLNFIPLMFNFGETALILLVAIIFIFALAQPGDWLDKD
ncbi:DUF4178 domain-containing protein [Massilia atriviolacea]|uniref:DUF4178 domain-containing protein n=1 Tax=Massilia atriviolacea TaxID=2495579 RepID=A0A430HET9_9BURK|nr:DUF4178 domain-containing protein [Massilia atriviolacea]RSZ56058.1 DUF4178 domain-containing protein [Massilia atriviolacea]